MSPEHFDRNRDQLLAVVSEIDGRASISPQELNQILRRYPKDDRGLYSKRDLIAAFRQLAPTRAWSDDEATFLRKVRLKPIRSLSGVTPVTVLTKPFPCPGKCVFCPSDARMPKSYLSNEPGAQRAAANAFDPYLQTYNRLAAFAGGGHSVDKIELIILGGTWSHYPEEYQRWFITRCLDAMSDYGAGRDRRDDVQRGDDFRGVRATIDGARIERTYNEVIRGELRASQAGALLNAWESTDWATLEAAQRHNEDARCRSVGLVVETRPDHIDDDEVVRVRRLGATKVQLGVQSLDDRILEQNARGHTVADTRRAFELLRCAAFKLHAHWMPNLHGATVESDIEDFRRLFDDADFRPDELKIYPCSLLESAELMRHYESGAWRPYTRDQLLEVLTACVSHVPPWCRVTRVVRDIPSPDIVVGNKTTNFREVVDAELRRRGTPSRDIRAREIGAMPFRHDELRLQEIDYETSAGSEHFLQFTTAEDRIVAFLRLCLPRRVAAIDEIASAALVREVHVYGTAMDVGDRAQDRAQHGGLGLRLLDEAAAIAQSSRFASLAVISAIGTRPYYRKAGFTDGELYQHRPLA